MYIYFMNLTLGYIAFLASGFMVQRFCDYGGIYYRDFSQQSDALARMGLQ